MAWMLAPVAGVALLFFLVLPGVGAFLARARWRTFRSALSAVSRWPTADARHEPPSSGAGEPDGFVGFHRFFGSLEALQGDDRIWLSGAAGSVAVDLRGVSVYLLPAATGTGRARADEELSSVPWNRIFALSEGTTLLVGGALYREEGRSIFKARDGTPPLALIYDCPRSAIMRRAIRGGRHVNEYWNPFTLPSLVTGSFILAVLAWILMGRPDARFAAVTALAAAVSPLTPFLPPAFPLYFLYRLSWRHGRRLRAERDLANLPLRWFPTMAGGTDQFVTLLPDLEPYAMLRGTLVDSRTLDAGGLRVRLPEGSILASEGEVWAFGTWREDRGEVSLAEPDDPLAELAVVAGDPRVRAARCSSGARRYLAASAALIGLTVAVNLFLVLYLAARLVG
ncbi:MAG: hypothetical protein NTU62_01680 [Spirochaetes bacterium]|nr:hypothetical protein [Spirochaetota bacterium]